MKKISPLSCAKASLQKRRSKKARATAVELCAAGLLTCTRGEPGDEAATYALAWEPLDHAEQFSAEVRAKHAANMAKLTDEKKRRHERPKAGNRGY